MLVNTDNRKEGMISIYLESEFKLQLRNTSE